MTVTIRRPSFGVAKAGEQPRVFFTGLPMGHEFTSLILALLQVSGYAPKVSDEVLNQIKGKTSKLTLMYSYRLAVITVGRGTGA